MGTYTLLVTNREPFEREVGARGPVTFPAGAYAYTGSVPGESFTRVRRHAELCAGERETTHWHVDYLLTASSTVLAETFTTTADAECDVVAAIEAEAFGELGASDCTRCRSHFHWAESRRDLRKEVETVYETIEPGNESR